MGSVVARVSSPTFVGRRPELDRMEAVLLHAREGRPSVILVAGEAGVGKTRFVQQAAGLARASGARVLEGGCVQVGIEGLPFGPIVEALRNLTNDLTPGTLDELLGSGRAELSRLMPNLVRKGDEPLAGGQPDSSAQGRLFEHLLLMLGRLAEKAPLVLVVEDVHWADRSTLELLAFLARNLRQGPLAVMITYRSDELHRRHPLLPFLAELERSGRAERIELTRFDRTELAEQLAAILGAQPDAELVSRILARSEGNAFFAEELLMAGLNKSRLPETLRDVLLARVATLSERAQDLVRVAAAGGSRISPQLLADVLGVPVDGLDAGLDEAVSMHILVSGDEGAEERYAFRHALVQEAVYSDLLPGRRTRLHAAFAKALAEDSAVGADASRAAELAYHWQAAHDLPRAFDTWIAAGIAAEGIYAFAQGLACFEHALELWDQVPDATARAPMDRADLLARTAHLSEAPDPHRSVAYIREAIDLLDPAADPTRSGLLHERLGNYTWSLMETRTAEAAFGEAVRLVPAEPPSVARSSVLSGLGRYHAMVGHATEAVALCEEALSVARAISARDVESRALRRLGLALVVQGDIEAGLSSIDRAREIDLELGDAYEVCADLCIRSEALLLAGRYPEAVPAARQAEDHSARHGLGARFGMLALTHLTFALLELGRWDEAVEAVARAQRRETPTQTEFTLEAFLLLIDARRGQFELAEPRAQRVQQMAANILGWEAFPFLAELALWQADPLAAREAVRLGVAGFEGEDAVAVRRLESLFELGIRAEADLAALARTRHADAEVSETRRIGAAYLARMRAAAEDVEVAHPMRVQEAASLAACEAEFSRLEGVPEPDRWASAAEAYDGWLMPFDRAYALMREAEAVLAQHRDRPRAARVLKEAHGIAISLGALPLRQAVEGLAGRAGIALEANAVVTNEAAGEARLPETSRAAALVRVKPPAPAPRGRHDLTPRELEVLRLLAAGHSDGEIAEALFISKKTASVHVAAIKGKLGARSRVEIATDAIGLGLIEARGGVNRPAAR